METTSKKTIAKVERYSALKLQMNELSKEISDLAADLKETMAHLETNILVAGDYAMVISDRERKDLDKDKVKSLLGDDYNSCLKKVPYKTFEVKKAKGESWE